jgi:hypothetical protein
VLAAAVPVAEHLLGLEWHLIKTPEPEFIISDRPMPKTKIGYEFSLGLSANFGLRCCYPSTPLLNGLVTARAPLAGDINRINVEVRGRAREWICGPGSSVHNL